jgi:hypothetical protein
MTPRIRELRENSGLPGPRANLELMLRFARSATRAEADECLSFMREDLADSPEEYMAMCGVVASCILERGQLPEALAFARPFASHRSWRIREAVAIGIQEIAAGRMGETLDAIEPWLGGGDLELRAVVAALCEPRLLGEEADAARVLAILKRITLRFEGGGRLDEDARVLRQALGYGLSVATVAAPERGKALIGALAESPSPHLRWIAKENLGKKRLEKMDRGWVESVRARIGKGKPAPG